MFQGRWGIFPAADNNGNIPVWPGALLGVDGRAAVRRRARCWASVDALLCGVLLCVGGRAAGTRFDGRL